MAFSLHSPPDLTQSWDPRPRTDTQIPPHAPTGSPATAAEEDVIYVTIFGNFCYTPT
ncbi:hypothetical protein L1047_13815 [Synechococcus sp. Nb3U1]|nr:hypothetical protein [Synechococcus sp. Nb3U1]